jgi:transcriptional regulator with XRE-family HTH domain
LAQITRKVKMSNSTSDRGVRYTETVRALIATLLGDLSFTEVQALLSGKAPTYPTLKAIADEYNVTPPQSKRGRKTKAVKPAKSKRRGRPPGSKNKPKVVAPVTSSKRGRRYDEAAKVKLVALIEQHGLTGTMKVLGDESPSIVTLHNIAKEAGVTLTRGRPAAKEAA